jgi:hypothetical protein
MKNPSVLPRARTKDLVIRELGDETLVYDLVTDKAHCLNQCAALVWKSCDGKTTAEKAARALSEKLGAPVDKDVVWLALDQLRRFDLVESYEPPRLVRSVTRRDLVLKYAPAVLALPAIMSISAPTPAQNASCVCPNCCPGFICNISNMCVSGGG